MYREDGNMYECIKEEQDACGVKYFLNQCIHKIGNSLDKVPYKAASRTYCFFLRLKAMCPYLK